jgi:hypothetical protein
MFQIKDHPEAFLDMMDVQQEVEVAAPNFPQAAQGSTDLTLNHSLSATALDCLTTVKAPGIVKSYSTVVKHFQAFYLLAGHPFPYFTIEAVTEFVLHHMFARPVMLFSHASSLP